MDAGNLAPFKIIAIVGIERVLFRARFSPSTVGGNLAQIWISLIA